MHQRHAGRLDRHVGATIAVTALVVAAVPAAAKILPYEPDVSPTKVRVGRTIEITMSLDPQNVLGDEFDFEIAVYRARHVDSDGFPRPAAKPVAQVVMRLLSGQRYQGTFTPGKAGRYVVVGHSASTGADGYPSPIPIRVTAPVRDG